MKSDTRGLRCLAVLTAVLVCLAVQAVFTLPAYGQEIVGWGDNSVGQATPPAGNDFIAVAAGFFHSLALKSDGTIVGWGYNGFGQAAPPMDNNNFIAVSAGHLHSLALKSDGSIVGWGITETPPAGNDFIAVAAGYGHSLALKSDGSIVGWGDNSYGQATPPAGNNFIAIAAGGVYSLALKSDGSIAGWGDNSYGRATPPAGNNFIAITASAYHSLALKSDGSIVGWGWNGNGEATPPAGNDFIAVAAGYEHSLALKSDGSIVGWGYNGSGQATPPAGNNFIAVAAGGDHSLALRRTVTNRPPAADAGENQTVYAWIDGFADVTLDGSDSNDEDGDELTYKWTWTIDANTYEANSVSPTIELPIGVHTIQLVVNDGYADSALDDVNIIVKIPPVANADPDQTVYAWIDGIAEVTLDGSDSNDADGDMLTYKWTWTIDANTYEANGVSPTIELPIGVHTIQLVVNDGYVDSAPDDVNVTVVAPLEGNLKITPQTINRKSNQPDIRASIKLPGNITKSDVDLSEPLVLYPGGIKATKQSLAAGNGISANFNKDALMNAVPADGNIELKVAGKLKSGQYFYGCDTVKVIK